MSIETYFKKKNKTDGLSKETSLKSKSFTPLDEAKQEREVKETVQHSKSTKSEKDSKEKQGSCFQAESNNRDHTS